MEEFKKIEKTNLFEIENKDKVFGILSLLISSALFLASGVFLEMELAYLVLTVVLVLISILTKQSLFGFISSVPFVYLLWKIGSFPSGDIFLFIIGFICSFIFLFQYASSLGKETDLFASFGSGIIFSFLFTIFAAMKYQLFSSLFIVSPVGIIVILAIIIFFRIQYYLWKGK